jgi:hypothetical protein
VLHAKDYERTPKSNEAMIDTAMSARMLKQAEKHKNAG